MVKKLDKKEKKVLINDFTLRLLEVYKELVMKDAMPEKVDFSHGLGITIHSFNKIEGHKRNFPKGKVPQAKNYLETYFFVNKRYWDYTSVPMFTQEPPQRRFIPTKVEHNFKDLRSVEKISKELDKVMKTNKALEAEVQHLREELVKYKTKSSRTATRTKDKGKQ